jgi:hypothetical protein
MMIHSPFLGPATWQPSARALQGEGRSARVPSLLAVGRSASRTEAERGIEVDHVTVYRWRQTFTAEFVDAALWASTVSDSSTVEAMRDQWSPTLAPPAHYVVTKQSMIEVLARAVEVRRVDGTARQAIGAASTPCGE